METSVNNKCKAFTSLEQSRKLAEILPLESADMHYSTWTILDGEFIVSQNQGDTIKSLQEDYGNQIIPCWSLAALFSVIPEGIIENYYIPNIQKENGKYSIAYGDEELLCEADNPVDACYEMILKLHKSNLLRL